ncbi:hypothetical protein Tco_0778387 [Tanacetum coccineum]
MPVAKSPYRLTPTEMEELSNQLKEIYGTMVILLIQVSSPYGVRIGPVHAHRQEAPVVDNHNHNERRSNIIHTSMIRSGVVEGE